MPFKSEAQRRLFYAAASGKAKDGPSKEVAEKFIKDSKKERFSKIKSKMKKADK